MLKGSACKVCVQSPFPWVGTSDAIFFPVGLVQGVKALLENALSQSLTHIPFWKGSNLQKYALFYFILFEKIHLILTFLTVQLLFLNPLTAVLHLALSSPHLSAC